jgi:3-isopropylmalate/(R)-2-methylmalate dehydratase small subunit
MMLSGKAVKFGDNVDTDLILPSKYLVLTNPEELAQHAMEGLDPAFYKKSKDGVILVAGKNFGCGSSREHAPLALKYAGVKCILAESFARIFYRNSINIGLPVAECEGISGNVEESDNLTVDLEGGAIKNQSKNKIIHITPIPHFILEILSDGGLTESLRKRIRK